MRESGESSIKKIDQPAAAAAAACRIVCLSVCWPGTVIICCGGGGGGDEKRLRQVYISAEGEGQTDKLVNSHVT